MWIDVRLIQRLYESLPGGILTNEFIPVTHNAVYRSHQRGGFSQSIQIRDHGYFVGNSTVATSKAHYSHAANRIAETLCVDLEVNVSPVQAVVLKGTLNHVLRGIFCDGFSEVRD